MKSEPTAALTQNERLLTGGKKKLFERLERPHRKYAEKISAYRRKAHRFCNRIDRAVVAHPKRALAGLKAARQRGIGVRQENAAMGRGGFTADW